MVELGDKTYTADLKRLRDWLSLEEIKDTLSEAAEHKDREHLADALYLYVSVAFGMSKDELENLPWMQIATAFNDECQANAVDLSHIAFLRGQTPDDKKDAWDYDGRVWWTWAHIFSKEFGWEVEYVANLEVLSAFSLLQEILLNQQFEREWEWTLSEYSLKYNKTTKQSDPNPLPRPKWMKTFADKTEPTIKTIKIPKDMMPVGNVIKPPKS